jgi:hypothetical protein
VTIAVAATCHKNELRRKKNDDPTSFNLRGDVGGAHRELTMASVKLRAAAKKRPGGTPKSKRSIGLRARATRTTLREQSPKAKNHNAIGLTTTESPQHPQPDDIPDDERTGGEPEPPERPGKSKKENTPPRPRREDPAD